jgi:hypothetical protein
MDTNTTTDPAATLAAIIREVDGRHDLSADALACAILAHPASQWGPVLPVPTDVELEADFRAWFKTRYDSNYFGGISLCDAIAWGKRLLQQSPQPAAPWPRLPEKPPNAEDWGSLWEQGYRDGWNAARAQVELQREQAGVASTPAPTINYRHILSPEPGFELLSYDGDPEKLPRDAQRLGGKWWGPRFGSDSLAATLGAALERMVAATSCVVEQPMKDSNKTSPELHLSGDLIDHLIKKGTRDALTSKAEELALALLKVLQIANGKEIQ